MATHAEVFEDVLSARGGRAAFTTETLAIASALGHASLRAAEGDATAAASLPALAALLPPPKSPPQDAFDVLRLSDRDRAELRRLITIGTGKVPPTSAGWKPRSARLRGALRLMAVLDRIEARIAASDRPYHGEATPAECHEAYCALAPLIIGTGVTVAAFLTIAGVGARPRVDAADVEVLPPIEARALPALEHVVPLPKRPSSPGVGLGDIAGIGDNGPLTNTDHWGRW